MRSLTRVTCDNLNIICINTFSDGPGQFCSYHTRAFPWNFWREIVLVAFSPCLACFEDCCYMACNIRMTVRIFLTWEIMGKMASWCNLYLEEHVLMIPSVLKQELVTVLAVFMSWKEITFIWWKIDNINRIYWLPTNLVIHQLLA